MNTHYQYILDSCKKDINGYRNWFVPILDTEILKAEAKLGYSFPPELRKFYEEVGQGMLRIPFGNQYNSAVTNEILPPHAAANFALGELEWEGQTYWMSTTTYEDEVEPGMLPFMDVSDSSQFFYMKPLSDNPNAVWANAEVKIEDSFERFIWRLYYESPDFYDAIITQYYEEHYPKGDAVPPPPPPEQRGPLWDYLWLSYLETIRDLGAYDELVQKGEAEAERLIKAYPDKFFLNHCPKCQNLKKSPQANLCLNCGDWSDPTR